MPAKPGENKSPFENTGYDLLFTAYDIATEAQTHVTNVIKLDGIDAAAISGTRNAKKTERAELAAHATEWESEVAIFLGRHFGEQQKNDFLKAVPSIEQGLQKEKKSWVHFIGPPMRTGSQPKEESLKWRIWELTDSLSVRIKKLEASTFVGWCVSFGL